MSAPKTPLVQTLILAVLTLNLVGIVLLILQGRTRTQPAPATVEAPAEVIAETSFEVAPPAAKPAPAMVSRRTNAVLQPNPAGTAPGWNATMPLPPAFETEAAWHEPPAASAPRAQTFFLPGSLAGTPFAGSSAIAGQVWISGTLPPEVSMRATDPVCGQLNSNGVVTSRHFVVTDDGRLANVFVYIKEGLENARFAAPTNGPVLDNRNCQFEPYILGVQVGQPLALRNSDSTLHNVHFVPRLNRELNLGLPTLGQRVVRAFDKPEILLRVKCDVHPWMFAFVNVVPHPFHAVTEADGSFRFPPGLPPGVYTVAAVHPKAGELTQQISVGADEAGLIKFYYRYENPPQQAAR